MFMAKRSHITHRWHTMHDMLPPLEQAVGSMPLLNLLKFDFSHRLERLPLRPKILQTKTWFIVYLRTSDQFFQPHLPASISNCAVTINSTHCNNAE